MTVTLSAPSAPQLSQVRTFLFGGLALVWFGEMLFTGVPSFAVRWTRLWKMYAPDNPQLATALYITHAFEAPLKAALLVLGACPMMFGPARTSDTRACGGSSGSPADCPRKEKP
jgi:hypothetical protein